jgi:hypothetical protein
MLTLPVAAVARVRFLGVAFFAALARAMGDLLALMNGVDISASCYTSTKRDTDILASR